MSIRRGRLLAAASVAAAVALGALAWYWLSPHLLSARAITLSQLAQAPRNEPIRVEGTVTYFDAERHLAVLQDDTAALALTLPAAVHLKVAQRVRLSGTLPVSHDPRVPGPLSLQDLQISTLHEQGPLPVRKATLREFNGGAEPVRLELAGIVESLQENDGGAVINIIGESTNVRAVIPWGSVAQLDHLLDAKVALRGVRLRLDPTAVAPALVVPGVRDITVVESPSTAARAVDTLHTLLADATWSNAGHRIRVKGRVLQGLSDRSFLLTDEMVSVPVRSARRLEVRPDETLEVEGWPVISQRVLTLQGAKVVARGVELPPAGKARLTHAAQVRNLTAEEASQTLPVRLEGVVIGVTALLGNIFIRDETGGAYVRVADQPIPLSLGQKVVVRGVAVNGDFAPTVTNAIIEPGPIVGLPPVKQATVEDLNDLAADMQWVEIEGKIRAIQSFGNLHIFNLVMKMGPTIQIGATEIPKEIELSSLTDARVRIRGILAPWTNAEGHIVGHRLGAFPLRYLEVLSRPKADPFQGQPRSIGDLLHHVTDLNDNRTHVAGTVVMQHGDTVYIEDGSDGLKVTGRAPKLKRGDIVSAVGYAAKGIYGPTMLDAQILKTGESTTPQPVAATLAQAMSGRFEFQLIALEGRVLTKTTGAQQQTLILQSEGYTFETEVAQQSPLTVEPGSIVRVSGICIVPSVVNNGPTLTPNGFRMLVADADDITVLRQPPWWNATNATFLLSATACGTLIVLAWVGSLRRRVRAQTQEIETRGQFLRQVIDIAPNFIFAKDRDGRFTLANSALAEVYGTTPEQMIGKTVSQVTGSTSDAICSTPDDEKVIEARHEGEISERLHIDTSGVERWVEITRRPIIDAAGAAVGVLTVANNITQRKLDQERLIQARNAAEAANKAKSEFLANMSHEIRTPLNGVIGMLDLLDKDSLDTEQRSMLDTALSSADTLLAVINDVLDFSKIEAGKLTLEQLDVELAPLIEEVTTLFANQAHEKGIELSCLVHQDVPATVRGDPTRLRQILTNLISNAIKFTERGEVFIDLELLRTQTTPAGADVAHVQVKIRDTGIGMSAEVIQHLFQAFTQADSSTTRRYGGTGLGLTIARRLSEAMNGSLKVASVVGSGSTFSVTLPLPVVKQSAASPTPEGLRGVKALVVDDNATNRLILQHYLTSFGMQCLCVESARDGLDEARRAARSGAPFGVILLDYHMPEMDGLGFLAEQQADRQIASIPSIVLSSIGDRGGLPAEMRVVAWLSKPVRRSALLGLLATTCGRTEVRAQAAGGPKATSPDLAGLRVLLAEDNPVNQKVAMRVLSGFGVDVTLATNGDEALTLARQGDFDAILMDCHMPKLDGYEATRGIREWETTTGHSHTPVIAMTANALAEDRARCLASGMDDHLPKPFRREDLAAMLEKWLRPAPPTHRNVSASSR